MKQIIISGFGGQGVISLGLMLAYAAMTEGVNTSFLPSYGPEMRGGTANCSVVISDKEVASPVISRPDILVAMNEPSLTRFVPNLAQGGRIFYDDATAPESYRSRPDFTAVPLDALCGGNHKAHNIAFMGAILPLTGLKLSSAEEAVKKVFKNKPQFIEANLACLRAGFAFAQQK